MTSNPETAEPTVQPYTMWSMECPFRKNGSPVLGTMGASVRDVIVMEAETFKRMLREHPSLVADTVKYNIGSF